jgi:hypothetical protein
MVAWAVALDAAPDVVTALAPAQAGGCGSRREVDGARSAFLVDRKARRGRDGLLDAARSRAE